MVATLPDIMEDVAAVLAQVEPVEKHKLQEPAEPPKPKISQLIREGISHRPSNITLEQAVGSSAQVERVAERTLISCDWGNGNPQATIRYEGRQQTVARVCALVAAGLGAERRKRSYRGLQRIGSLASFGPHEPSGHEIYYPTPDPLAQLVSDFAFNGCNPFGGLLAGTRNHQVEAVERIREVTGIDVMTTLVDAPPAYFNAHTHETWVQIMTKSGPDVMTVVCPPNTINAVVVWLNDQAKWGFEQIASYLEGHGY